MFDNPLKQPWDGITAQTIVYARNTGPVAETSEQFLVLSANCAHLGCPVSWFPQSGLFMCPCHGGVYYEDGERASGPPPRGLYHCVWRVEKGRLQIQAPHYPTLQNPLVLAESNHRLKPQGNSMFGWLKSIGRWFDVRMGFSETLMPVLRHPVPREIEGPIGWWYVFGSASLTFLLIQIFTGIGLSLVYVPAAEGRTRACCSWTISSRSVGFCGRCTTMPGPAWS